MKSVSPATVLPMPTPPAPHGQVLGFGFTKLRTNQRILLLVNQEVNQEVNTGDQLRSVSIAGGGAAGATHMFIDESHGHGIVEPGREMLNATSVLGIGAFGISLVSWNASLPTPAPPSLPPSPPAPAGGKLYERWEGGMLAGD